MLIFAMLRCLPVAAEDHKAIVRADPLQLAIGTGQTAMLDVILADAQSVYGIDVRATFDPQLVEVVDAEPAKDGIQVTPGGFPKPDFVALNIVDNQAGTIQYAVTQVNPTEPVDGRGIVFKVTFRAKASDGQGAFDIGTVDLTDRDGIALGVQPESGVIRISPVTPITPTATPTAIPATPTSTSSPWPTVTAMPTNTPPSDASATATPAVQTPIPTSLPTPVAPVGTPAPLTGTSPTSVPDAAAQIVPPSDASGDTGKVLATIPAEPATSNASPLEQPTPQALAAAPAPTMAAPVDSPADAQPAVSAESIPEIPVRETKLTNPDTERTASNSRLQQQPRPTGESHDRATSDDPSRVLLAIGIMALVVAAVTAVLIVVVLRR